MGYQYDGNDYAVNDLSTTSGLYFEKVSEIHFYEQEWTLVTYLNVTFLKYRQQMIDNYNNKIGKICNSQEESFKCNRILKIIQQRIPSIRISFNNLMHLMGHHDTRSKRGLLNVIGSGLKFLFGTMDQNDASNIDNAIEDLQTKQKESLLLLQDQTTILGDTVNNFNESINRLNRVEKEINLAIKNINNISENLQNELNKTMLSDYTLQLMDYLNILIIETEIDINVLTNVVMFTKTGKIHPAIIPVDIFLNKLIESQNHLPHELFYPVPLKEENIYILLEISSIICYSDNDKLTFVIKVPLTNSDVFELFNIIPIPQYNSFSTVIIKPNKKYLIISKLKTKSTIVDNIETDCKDIGFEKICKMLTLTNPYTNPVCETQLFLSNKMEDCDVRTLSQEMEIWHKLEKHNSWLFATTYPVTLTIFCKTFEDVKVVNTGILTIKNNKCRASTIHHTLVPDLGLISIYENKVIEKNLLDDDCCTDDNLKYTIALRPIDPIKITNLNLNELANTAHKINVARGRIADILSRPNPNKHFSYITYTTASIIVLIVIILCVKICKCNTGLCLKFCCFNNWFKKKEYKSNPIVIFKKSKSPKIKGIKDENSEEEYRFDL